MGKLLVMPSRTSEPSETGNVATRIPSAETNDKFDTNFTVWENAPRERTAPYFPTYSAVSKAIQARHARVGA